MEIDFSKYTREWVEENSRESLLSEREWVAFELFRLQASIYYHPELETTEEGERLNRLYRLVAYLDKAIRCKEPPDLSKYTDAWFENHTLEEIEKELDLLADRFRMIHLGDMDSEDPYVLNAVQLRNRYLIWIRRKRVPRHKRPFLDEFDDE